MTAKSVSIHTVFVIIAYLFKRSVFGAPLGMHGIWWGLAIFGYLAGIVVAKNLPLEKYDKSYRILAVMALVIVFVGAAVGYHVVLLGNGAGVWVVSILALLLVICLVCLGAAASWAGVS